MTDYQFNSLGTQYTALYSLEQDFIEAWCAYNGIRVYDKNITVRDVTEEYELVNKELGPFFCGMSRVMIMPSFSIRLNGPTSTTKAV